MARAAPVAGRNCLAKEIRLRSISMILMRGVATEEQAKAEDAGPSGSTSTCPSAPRTCDFCAFYQVRPTAESVEGFINSLGARPGSSIGTGPSRRSSGAAGRRGSWRPADLGAWRRSSTRSRAAAAPREWTVELAPASVTKGAARGPPLRRRDPGLARGAELQAGAPGRPGPGALARAGLPRLRAHPRPASPA
jgi:hypothetical protein